MLDLAGVRVPAYGVLTALVVGSAVGWLAAPRLASERTPEVPPPS
jgi:hypothetical protein